MSDDVDTTMESRLTEARDHLAEALEKVRNLEIALATGRTIGMAVGITMERMKLTADDAFTLLAQVSGAEHRKVHELAEDLVETGTIPDRSHRVA